MVFARGEPLGIMAIAAGFYRGCLGQRAMERPLMGKAPAEGTGGAAG